MNDFLVLDSVTIHAGDKCIVNDVSFSLKKGEIIGLIGESGAGKSTLGKAILGYLQSGIELTSGTITLNGVNLTQLTPSQLHKVRGRQISYVAQSASSAFNPAKRIGTQVIESSVVHGVMSKSAAKQRALELFESLRLPSPEDFYYRFPHQVSGGQLQRAMIAMSLCAQPELVIFDEPTTALDVTTQLEVLLAIKHTVAKYHVSAIYISHDIAVVTQLANSITVLRHGQVVESGALPEILENPESPYTRLLFENTPPHMEQQETRAPVLQVKNLQLSIGNKAILKDISVTLGKGNTLAVIGESGAGKSTLARVICGLQPQNHGSITLHDQLLQNELKYRDRQSRRQIQLIHQNPFGALNPRLKVGTQLERALKCFTGLNKKERRVKSLELIKQVQLPADVYGRYPSQLSGGQLQRICIARAIGVNPDIILCDEPTSALDPLVAQDILQLLMDLQQKSDASLIFITHDLNIASSIADTIMVLRHGSIVRYGSSATIFNPPLDNYTQVLLQAVPQIGSEWLNKREQELLNRERTAAK